MALTWDKELNIDTIKELVDQTVGDLYLCACSATLNGKRAEKICIEAYSRLFSNREYFISLEKAYTPLEAAKYFLSTQLTKVELSRMDNDLFSLSRDRLQDQSLLDSITDRTMNRIEVDLPRYAPTYSGTRGTIYVLVLVLCIIAVVIFVWLNPFADEAHTSTDNYSLSVNVEPVTKLDPDLMIMADISPAQTETLAQIINISIDGLDADAVTDIACTDADGNELPVFSCNDEYHSFIAETNGTYVITLSSGNDTQVQRFITVSSIPEDHPLSKLSYSIVHDTPTELEFFSEDGIVEEYSIVRDPKNGTIERDSNGTFTYVPNEKFVGLDSFTVEIAYKDGSVQEVSVPVIIHNTAPYYKSELLTGAVVHTPSNNGLSIGKLEAFDPDGDELTYKLVDYSGCMPVLSSSGRYALQVSQDCVTGKGEAWFSFTVSDGVLTSEVYTFSLSLSNNTIDVFSLSQTLYCYTEEGGFYLLNLPTSDLDGDALVWTVLSDLTDHKTADGHEIRYSSDNSTVSIKLDPSLTSAAVHSLTLACSDGWTTSENVVMTLNILPNPGPIADAGNSTTVEMGQLEATCELSLKETSPFYSYRIISVNSEDGICSSTNGWDDLMFDFTLNPGLITASVVVTVEDTVTGQTADIIYTINVA